MGREHRVVWLNNSSRHLRSRGDSKGKLGLAAVVDGQTLQEKRSETRSSTTASGVEDEEALETSAVVSQLADSVEHEVDNLLANGVVTTGVVVGSILLARDDLLRVVELAVGASADFVTHSSLQFNVDGPRDMFSGAGPPKEGAECLIISEEHSVG